MLTEQATETVTIRTFSNQKPWVDRSIRVAVNHRTAAYNTGLLSGNMSEYKASCYALRRAIRAAKRWYRERIESHFQLNDSRRMWQGLKTICSSTAALNVMAARLCRAARQKAADRAAMFMLSPFQRTTFGGN